ncbi:hypothetical protein ACROYT_G022086 [Oculina patagonica]
MPFRVTPKEAILHEDHKMPSSISLQSKMNEVSMGNDSIPEQDNVNEQLLKEIDDIYSPVLKLMKLFGIYFGDTSLTQLTQGTGRCSKRVYLQRMYCGVVVSGFWLNFVMSFANIIFGDNIYVFIMITLWCLLIALCGTICLLVLCTPSADTAKSRFKYFIRGVLAVNSNVNFVKVKKEVFNELHKRMSSLPSIAIDMASLKMEYHKLCEVVELADKMLAPLLLGMVSVYIPLICFNFYQAVSLPQEEKLMSLMTSLFWLLAGASIFATLLLFGSNVSEKIQGFQKTYVQTFPVSKEEEGKLLMFILLDLQGDPKGLSIGGLAVITKSMSLTIVGVIVSYFTVMLSLPK